MSNEITLPQKGVMSLVDAKYLEAIESALALNDLSKLTTPQRISYYNAVCESVGLNPLTQPFAYITLDGKLTLYARKECSEQLRKLNRVSTQILSKRLIDDLYEVDVRASDASGRVEEETGIVFLKDKYGKRLEGTPLANAMMKALTKAKRRATLAISGLGLPDESELDSIPSVSLAENPQIPNPLKEVKDVVEAPEKPDEIPEVFQEDDLGSFVCKVGKKHVNKKLSEFDAFELDNFIKATKKWFADERKTPNADWNEFFDKAEAYLCSLEFGSDEPA